MKTDAKLRLKEMIILVAVGIAVNVGLAILKMYVGLSSNSITIMLDATNSFLDIITSIVTLVAIIVLFAPRSESAPFGYGRSEYLAGFVVAVASAVVGGLFLVQSINRMAIPEPVWFGWQNCVLICIAVPFKLAIGTVYYVRNKKLRSKAIAAIALDSFMDAGITSVSIVAFAVSSQIDYAADAIFGIVISVLVLIFAIKMIVENIRSVVKGDGCEDERRAVKGALKQDGRIKRTLKITMHDYGVGARACTAQAVFKDGVSLDEVIEASERIAEEVKERCGVELSIVPVKEQEK